MYIYLPLFVPHFTIVKATYYLFSLQNMARSEQISLGTLSLSSKSCSFLTHPYKVLMAYMNTNGLKGKRDGRIIDCFEREYQ